MTTATIEGLTKRYGPNVVFDTVDLRLGPGVTGLLVRTGRARRR